ncbi:MAG: hypothetical protein IJ708_14670 [Clostridia bacterium]|nr:hypothetical protein [Clostridia bacterium]
MKKRMACILAAILLSLILPCTLLLADRMLPTLYGESYYAVLPDMVERLDSAPGKRLIVLGNSDVAFGLDGEGLEQALKGAGETYTVCPFGLYGAVGSAAMLSLSRNALREGDLVVLVVEPVEETLSDYFGAESFLRCAESDRSLLLRLNAAQRNLALGALISDLAARYNIVQSGIAPRPEMPYAREAFNERMDMTYARAGNEMLLGFDVTSPIRLGNVRVDSAFAEMVADYVRHARARGAEVVVSFSPMNRSAVEDMAAMATFFGRVNEALACTVISDPNRYVLDSGWFYDSNFHLNTAGARYRTQLLAEDILCYLGHDEALGFDRPEMPEKVAEVASDAGEDSVFVFTKVEGAEGFLVSGVTGAGREAQSLTVPAYHLGLPVVGLTEAAFTGAEQLEELFIPSTVLSLPAGLFAGNPVFVRLVLLPRDRLPDVGENLFGDNTKAAVLVPAADYSMYRDGVGCETNPWERYLGRLSTY